MGQMPFTFNDGGRAWTRRQPSELDSATRAIAIVTGLDYEVVWCELAELCELRNKKRRTRIDHPDNGIGRDIIAAYLDVCGFRWVPTMFLGARKPVHLAEDELPVGKLVCQISKEWCAVVDGVIQNTYDPSREGQRIVYGYFELHPFIRRPHA